MDDESGDELACVIIEADDEIKQEDMGGDVYRKGPSTYYITKKCQFFNTPYPI